MTSTPKAISYDNFYFWTLDISKSQGVKPVTQLREGCLAGVSIAKQKGNFLSLAY